jgi:peptide/nickel transport system substrate-binding protein
MLEIRESIDPDERRELFMELLVIAREEFYVIGTALNADGYQVVQNNFRNVPESYPDSWLYPDPGPVGPEQFYRES